MIIPSMKRYEECTSVMEKQRVQLHTFSKSENKEIQAILKDVAEDIPPVGIAKHLQLKGYHHRVVARFKNQDSHSMHTILVIVPGSENKIKSEKTTCDIEVKFEHQMNRKRIGQCYNCRKFGHTPYNCRAEPVRRHCLESTTGTTRGPINVAVAKNLTRLHGCSSFAFTKN
ncbi:hypothetical protein JTB14_003499 [Gonioctena quinquepunctata]|nr:hypothetical protein JTB14_003499 [Gonioctena quinquepunctata]